METFDSFAQQDADQQQQDGMTYKEHWKQRVAGSHKKNKFSNVNQQMIGEIEELNMPIEDTSYQIEEENPNYYSGQTY